MLTHSYLLDNEVSGKETFFFTIISQCGRLVDINEKNLIKISFRNKRKCVCEKDNIALDFFKNGSERRTKESIRLKKVEIK